jgi:hypothetical protein
MADPEKAMAFQQNKTALASADLDQKKRILALADRLDLMLLTAESSLADWERKLSIASLNASVGDAGCHTLGPKRRRVSMWLSVPTPINQVFVRTLRLKSITFRSGEGVRLPRVPSARTSTR